MSATVAAALKKIAVAVLTNKKLRRVVLGIILGIIIIIMMPMVAILSIFSGDIDIDTDRLQDIVMEEMSDEEKAKLQTVEDCYDFFEDLCTIAELRAMVQRFQVARMLDEGRIYSDIVQETGASTATISRVNKCLVYGSDGYRKMLDRLKEDETAEESHE